MKKIISQYYAVKAELRTEFIRYFYADEEGEKDVYLAYLDDPNEGHWIGNGNTLSIGDMYLDLEQVVFCLEHYVPCDTLCDWYWFNLENHEREDIMNINLENYSAYRQRETHEQIVQWLKDEVKKRQTPEYKAECEASLKKIVDEGRKELEKYITNK